MTPAAYLAALPKLPRDADGPVFAAPWQAQAFAMTIALHERGLFTWSEWAEALAHEISAAQARGDAEDGSTYYQQWLTALERLVVEKGIASKMGLANLAETWRQAAAATPHGQPIVLSDRRG